MSPVHPRIYAHAGYYSLAQDRESSLAETSILPTLLRRQHTFRVIELHMNFYLFFIIILYNKNFTVAVKEKNTSYKFNVV